MESRVHRTVIGRYGDALGLSARMRGSLGDSENAAPGFAFALVVSYAVLEYGRPQDAIPVLAYLKLSLLNSGLLLFGLARYTRSVPWFRAQLVFLTLVLGMMFAWVPFATNNYWALRTSLVVFQTFLFVLSFCAFVDRESRLRLFLWVWVAAGLYQAVWGSLHAGVGSGYFQSDENDFALSMCMILPFAVMLAASAVRWHERLLGWASAVMCVAAIVVSNSRGGFVGLVVTGGMMILLHRRRLRLLLAGAAAVAALALLAPGAYWAEMRTITEEGGTRADRVELWTIAERVFQANPILGVGPNNINWVLNDYQVYEPGERMNGGRAVHSIYYTLLPELGVLGALLFLGILLANARDLRAVIRAARERPGSPLDAYARAIACSLIAYLVCGIFLSVLWYPHFYFLSALALTTRTLQDQAGAAAAPAPAPVPGGALESPA